MYTVIFTKTEQVMLEALRLGIRTDEKLMAYMMEHHPLAFGSISQTLTVLYFKTNTRDKDGLAAWGVQPQ